MLNVGDHAQWQTLCSKYGHKGSQNQGIPRPTCAFTGLFPSVISSKDNRTRSSRWSRNPTVPMTHQKNYQNTTLSQFSLQNTEKEKQTHSLIFLYFKKKISKSGQNANTCIVPSSCPVKRSSPAAPPRLSAGKEKINSVTFTAPSGESVCPWLRKRW